MLAAYVTERLSLLVGDFVAFTNNAEKLDMIAAFLAQEEEKGKWVIMASRL